MDFNNFIKNARAMSYVRNLPKKTDTDREPPYLEQAASSFMLLRGHLSGNVYAGLIEDSAFTQNYTPCKFRVMPVPSPIASSAHRRSDYLLIKFLTPDIGFVALGTKIKFNSNPNTKARDTYLVFNPDNLTRDIADTQIKKCNRIWNRLDYYGNIISEPFAADDITSTAVDSAATNSATNVTVQRDSLSCIMQKNEQTRDLKENDRFILGGLGYSARGVINHARTITDEIDSANLIAFTLERNREDTSLDDLTNDIVGGLGFNWTITLSADDITVMPGDFAKITATSLRQGATPEKPYSYIWESSNPSVVSVDADGNFYALALGSAEITCRLFENPAIFNKAVVTVDTAALDNFTLAFEPEPPKLLNSFKSVTISCFLLNNGVKTTEPVTFAFSGADAMFYKISDLTDNEFTLTCLAPAPKLLIIEAQAVTPGATGITLYAKTEIKLLGV